MYILFIERSIADLIVFGFTFVSGDIRKKKIIKKKGNSLLKLIRGKFRMEEKLLELLKLADTLNEKQDKVFAEIKYEADNSKTLRIIN